MHAEIPCCIRSKLHSEHIHQASSEVFAFLPPMPGLMFLLCSELCQLWLWLFLAISWAALNYVLFIHDLYTPGKRPVILSRQRTILPWCREWPVTWPNLVRCNVLGLVKWQTLLKVSLVQDHVGVFEWCSCAVIRYLFLTPSSCHCTQQWFQLGLSPASKFLPMLFCRPLPCFAAAYISNPEVSAGRRCCTLWTVTL